MWQLAGEDFTSRLILGTSDYPSMDILKSAIEKSKTQVITVSLKNDAPEKKGGQSFWNLLQSLNCKILPNTAGCRNANEAIEIALMARDIFQTNWIKCEVIGDDYLLQPHPFELVKAAEKLNKLGFDVFPYCTDDLIVCHRLVESGCKILMPWGAPIGSGKGLLNPFQLKVLRNRFPDIKLIVDAGLGSPTHALEAMLLGFDGILLNTAIAKSFEPIKMAKAFALAVQSGRLAFEAGIIPEVDFAVSCTSLKETLFWEK